MTATEALPAPLAEYLADQIPKAAAKAHRRFRAVPAEDLEQAMWLRALRKQSRFITLWNTGKLGAIRDELRWEGTARGREDQRYRLACKALADGYSVYDIQFYSTGVLAKLLSVLTGAGFDVPAAIANASAGVDAAGVHIRSSDPFAGQENYTVILTDVAGAYGRLPEGMQRLLKTYYAVSQDDTDEGRWDREKLASSMGLTADSLRQRVHRALQRLQDELGGTDPWL